MLGFEESEFYDEFGSPRPHGVHTRTGKRGGRRVETLWTGSDFRVPKCEVGSRLRGSHSGDGRTGRPGKGNSVGVVLSEECPGRGPEEVESFVTMVGVSTNPVVGP